ncbi:MAG TPA: efflux RND transporter permease subunit [Gammaproteobacteria bacterium]|nr:efflux RND transporter permease subunit [Gammaproteobacteria bacterium]
MRVVSFSIANPLVTNLLLVLVVVVGITSWYAMPQEMFPVVELDKVRVTTVFEGASPEEIERQVTLPIEEELDGMTDIDVITSTSSEGLSNILVEFKHGADIDEFLLDARTAIDRLTDLPEEAERPEITRLKTRFPVLNVALYGDVALPALMKVAERLKRRLLAVPGVASAGTAGEREWELRVVVDPLKLAARRVPVSLVTRQLQDNLRDLPGGSIEAEEGDILLRGLGLSPDPRTIGELVLRTNPQGGKLLLKEVADIHFQLEEARTLARFNGQPSVNITVTKTPDASTIDVSQRVRQLVEELHGEYPPTVRLAVYSDLSKYVKTRLDTVKSSGLVGLVLVLLSLYLFLNFRVAVITALGIPVSFLFATIMLHYLGYTINMVSLFAFLVVLGMIVDDAIIVTENIYRHMEGGLDGAAAAQKGAREVFWPVVASTATTIAAFMPMFSVGGTMGAFIAVIPVVVIFALTGSLLEVFGVLPSHACELLKVNGGDRPRRRVVDWGRLLERYVIMMRWCLHNRYLVSTAIVGVLAIFLTFAATRMSFELFGSVETGQFFVNVEAPNTYSIEDSARLAARIEALVMEEIGEDELDSLLTNVGVTFVDFTTIKFESNYIQLIIDLEKPRPHGFIERWVTPLVSLRFSREGTRERDTLTVINAIRARLQTLPGIQRLSILRTQGGPAGSDVEIGILGEDIEMLREQGDRIVHYLRQLPGVYDVRQDLEPGKLEYHYTLNERGRQMGLTQRTLAEAVRTGFQGRTVVHVTREDHRVPVRVIYPEQLRREGTALQDLQVVLPSGKVVYLGDVADIVMSRGANVVKRRDMQRMATVTAEVDPTVVTAIEVSDQVQREFGPSYEGLPGYDLIFLGEKRKAGHSIQDMLRAMVIALAVIFFILAALFKSLLDPLVVMVAIPFGIIGVIFGHWALGFHLQFLSLVGFLALAGIVVNDSLILVDFAKRLRDQGWERLEAMVEAGRVRTRPILLTSITTFLGVSPLIFFSTGQAAFLAPMAVSLGFGLLFATALILIGIPCFYLLADDLRRAVMRRET